MAVPLSPKYLAGKRAYTNFRDTIGVRQGLKWQEAKYIVLPFPDVKQRESIVKYLDNKCAEVDAVIEAKQGIIEELKAYKKSLIF
jgi:type I restriction enzyme S subunit